MIRQHWGVVALGLLGACGVSPAAADCGGDAGSRLVTALNETRVAADLPELELDVRLCGAAATIAADRITGRPAGMRAVTSVSADLRRRGYLAASWRHETTLGPQTVEEVLEHWSTREPDGFSEIVLGDWEDVGLGVELHVDGPIHVVLFGLESRTIELRRVEGLRDLETARDQLVEATNRARAVEGLPPLVPDDRLDLAAQGHADDMVAREYYAHRNPDGDRPRSRVAETGYRASVVAENIAKGLMSTEEVVENWMASSGHRANILRPEVTEIGFGVAIDESGDTITVLWVMIVARPG